MSGGGDPKTPSESEAYKALAYQAGTYFNRYQDVFVPLENSYINSVVDIGSEENYNQAAGAAGSAFTSQYSPELLNQQRQMLAQGVNPSSGKFQSTSQNSYGNFGSAMGLGMADASANNTDRLFGGMTNLVKMGQGIQSEATKGQIGLAAASEYKARGSAQTDFMKDQSNNSVAGTAVGIGAGYTLNR
jgi:hypothetical protein